jgi:trans-aconitate methyltransferase
MLEKNKKKYNPSHNGWDGNLYNKNSAAQEGLIRKILATQSFSPDEHILDIGCGDGRMTAYISTLVPDGSVLGIDTSQSMINFAQKNFQISKYPNLRFEMCDANQLSYKNSFDHIVSFNCLHWIADQKSILQKIRKALKPGGNIICNVLNSGNNIIGEAIDHVKQTDKWKSYFTKDFKEAIYPQNAVHYKKLLIESDFIPLSVKKMPYHYSHASKNDFSQALTACTPYVRQTLPQNLHLDFAQDLVAYICSHNKNFKIQEDGSITGVINFLFVHAKK